jgi:formate dehydrogenase major subunit
MNAPLNLTRPDGGKSCPDVWPRCHDQSLGRHQERDFVLIMGGNAAEAHPCGFKWVTEAKAHRKAKLIVVDPRFTRSAAVADFYAPIRPGTDIAFLGGVINYLLEPGQDPSRLREALHQRPFLVRDDFSFEDGIFSGYNAGRAQLRQANLGYQIGADGYAMVDDSCRIRAASIS